MTAFTRSAALRPDVLEPRTVPGRITVALVNNMPDAAMHATERQFTALLHAASEGLVVRLKLFSPPALRRSDAAARHVATCYDDWSEIENEPPDALIVTGCEPRAVRLEDEPLWPVLEQLTELAEVRRIPAIWSCMAAHAAVLRLGGPHRQRLPAKLSGLFRCRLRRIRHALLRGLPQRLHMVPHSRWSGLDAGRLEEAGFTILSHSAATGPDTLAFSGRAAHLLFQGHPEYGPTTLLAEYRRDVDRFLRRERDALPDPPSGYYGRATRARLAEFEAAAKHARDPALLKTFDGISLDLSTHHNWSLNAAGLYRNWLLSLRGREVRRASPAWRLRTLASMPRLVVPAARLTPIREGECDAGCEAPAAHGA